MKLLYGFLTLILALIISGVAAYFSVVGLAAIFSATFWAVVVMGCSLEAGKLVAAGWLHSNWTNPRVSKLHRGYMVSAVVVLMMITALGIYGFLAKGHLEQQQPLAPVELQIEQKQARIDQINADLQRLTTRQNQVDGAVNAVLGQDAMKGLRARRSLSTESADIRKRIDANTAELNKLTQELVPLKLQVNEVETKLGPIKYVADLFGVKDTEGAVRIVILMLMFAFDPLAVVLVLSAGISISDALRDKKQPREIVTIPQQDERIQEVAGSDEEHLSIFPESEVAVPMPPVEPPKEEEPPQEVENILRELEAEVAVRDDKEVLLDIFERKPELLEEMIQAVRESTEQPEEKPEDSGWIDDKFVPPPGH